MSWKHLHGIVKDWRDLNDEFPFTGMHLPHMVEGVLEGLSFERPDLELATLIIHEFERRGNKGSHKAKLAASKIRRELEAIGHHPISWLLQARQNLNLLNFEDEPNQQYTNSLYVILRDGYSEKNGRYGVYVGETSQTPEERFRQHISCINAGRGIPKYGIQLMYSLMWPWQKVPGAKRLYYEAALHKALELNNPSRLKISGNAEVEANWPKSFQKRLKNILKKRD